MAHNGTKIHRIWTTGRLLEIGRARICRQRNFAQSKRWQSYNIETSQRRIEAQFWSTSRVLLLTTFTSSLAYLYGMRDLSSHITEGGQPDSISSAKEIQSGYATTRDLEKAINELRHLLGDESISTDDEDLHNHGYSEWSSLNIDQLPVAVAYPKTTDEVSTIAKLCSEYKVPLIPYSGGSSLEANFSAPFGGVSVDFCFMDKVLELRQDDMDVTLQPGVGWMVLNEKIKHSGLFFPVDPGPSAMIGGMVGTGCSGTNAVRYGTMRDWVVNLTVVLADGTVIKTVRQQCLHAFGSSPAKSSWCRGDGRGSLQQVTTSPGFSLAPRVLWDW